MSLPLQFLPSRAGWSRRARGRDSDRKLSELELPVMPLRKPTPYLAQSRRQIRPMPAKEMLPQQVPPVRRVDALTAAELACHFARVLFLLVFGKAGGRTARRRAARVLAVEDSPGL